MFENEMLTRCAIGGTGIVLGLIVVLAHLPFLFLIMPVAVVFLGIVADPEETHAVWYGMLNTLGIFDGATLAPAESVKYAEKKHYFWFGEVGTAAALAGTFAVPLGIFLAGMTEITLAFIGAAVLFLPLFVFLPKVIQRGMKADVQSVIDTFGKNGQVKKVFWAVFTAMAGLVVARIIDPGTAHQIVLALMGMGV
ncbi:MAG TPA: hypothetical protein VMV55_00005 [Methanoregula sp.]|nr:hypothetical protein [Methanoregula sp.]